MYELEIGTALKFYRRLTGINEGLTEWYKSFIDFHMSDPVNTSMYWTIKETEFTLPRSNRNYQFGPPAQWSIGGSDVVNKP